MNWHTRANLALLGVVTLLGGLFVLDSTGLAGTSGPEFACQNVRVIDGDTFDCDGQRVRLQGIDAPELAGHCRTGRQCAPGDPKASSASLSQLTAFSAIMCRKTDTDHYGRIVARCKAGTKDLSCEQLERGQASRRYATILC